MIQPGKQANWQSLVSEQQTSGQSIAAFCRTREVSEGLFYYWRKRLREGAAPEFVEVQVAKPELKPQTSRAGLAATIEVRLNNGRSLIVPSEFDASHLRALLAVVESEYDRATELARAGPDAGCTHLVSDRSHRHALWIRPTRVYVGDAAHPYNVFDFTLHRGRDGPRYFLRDYQQVLLADAYGGYNGVVAGNQITRAGCWSHARRKIVEAEKVAPEIAQQAVALIGTLFAVEGKAKDCSDEKRLALRQAQCVPVLANLREKLLQWKQQLLPKHPMAEAVNYTLSQGAAEHILLRWRRAN